MFIQSAWKLMAGVAMLSLPLLYIPTASAAPGAAGKLGSKMGGDCSVLDENGCPVQMMNCDLVQPPTIFADGGLLETALAVAMRNDKCVPLVTSSDGEVTSVEWAEFDLRNYFSRATSKGETHGPTLRVRKAILDDSSQVYDPTTNPIVTPGTRIKLELTNVLPNTNTPASSCQTAQYGVCSQNPTIQCSCDPDDSACATAEDFTCDAIEGDTCKLATIAQESPNCFHGPEVTNLHYHGTHISPQPHQDYALLKLFSARQTDPPVSCAEDDPACAIGTYLTDINPLPWNQAPGTHWYHPHKHGATALQLINGMAGALLVGGEFDDFLYNLYKVDPTNLTQLERFEKVLLIQQLWDDVVFFSGTAPTGYPPYPLVNGQLIPTVHMQYGEVQRWRLISATTNASTQMAFSFSSTGFSGFEVKQISQDGIQFAPENYDSQPLGNTEDGYMLSPGNRVDLLVRAPDPPAGGGPTTFYVMRRVAGKVSDRVKKRIDAQNAFINKSLGLSTNKDETFTGAFIQVVVSGTAVPAMKLPADWPDMPPYLADITDATTERSMTFSMSTGSDGKDTTGLPSTKFYIDGMQYSDSCSGANVTLGDAETWTIMNASAPAHPFHIHINPFQLLEQEYVDGDGNTQNTVYSAPYPWMDTVALEAGTPTQPSVTTIQQQFEDYSGAYVLHCHFLGHEDRGMMTNVQAVCPLDADLSTDPISFGLPSSDGLGDDCTEATKDNIAPLPNCPASLEE